MAVTTPFRKPDTVNNETLDVVNGLGESAKSNYNKNKNKAASSANDIMDFEQSVSGQKLNPHDQNTNVAKTGGQYGTLNDKDYSTTLRLARLANAYNTRPRGRITSIGGPDNGGIQELGYAYEKPQLNTVEQQIMNQALGLDTAQKSAEQQLQAAINTKDYETFKALIQQHFGINLSDYQVRNAMDAFIKQTEAQDIMTRSMNEFINEYKRYFDASTAAELYNLAIKNEPFAQQLGEVLSGQVQPAGKAAQYAESYIQAKLQEADNKGPYDKTAVLRDAILDLEKQGIKYDVETKQATKVGNGTFANLFAWGRQHSDAWGNARKSPEEY